jgi:hypothetical protein
MRCKPVNIKLKSQDVTIEDWPNMKIFMGTHISGKLFQSSSNNGLNTPDPSISSEMLKTSYD